MTMYTRREDGTLKQIPAEHEQVLEQYRDSMPLVWEPQYAGDPYLYPLIDEDEEPHGTPQPGELERLGEEPAMPPNFEGLALAAVRAFLADEGRFTAGLHFECDDACGDCAAMAVKDVQDTAAGLKRAITRIARQVLAEQAEERNAEQVGGGR